MFPFPTHANLNNRTIAYQPTPPPNPSLIHFFRTSLNNEQWSDPPTPHFPCSVSHSHSLALLLLHLTPIRHSSNLCYAISLQRTIVKPTHSPLPMFRILSAFCLLGCYTPDSHRHLLRFMLRSVSVLHRQASSPPDAGNGVKSPIPSLLHGVVRNKLANLVHSNECQLARNCRV
jgi:hypothetical protein